MYRGLAVGPILKGFQWDPPAITFVLTGEERKKFLNITQNLKLISSIEILTMILLGGLTIFLLI